MTPLFLRFQAENPVQEEQPLERHGSIPKNKMQPYQKTLTSAEISHVTTCPKCNFS